MKTKLRRRLTFREETCLWACGSLIGATIFNVIFPGEVSIVYYSASMVITFLGAIWVLSDVWDMIQARMFMWMRPETFLLSIVMGFTRNIQNAYMGEFNILNIMMMVLALLIFIVVYVPVYNFSNISNQSEQLKRDILSGTESKQQARDAWTVAANAIISIRKQHKGMLQ